MSGRANTEHTSMGGGLVTASQAPSGIGHVPTVDRAESITDLAASIKRLFAPRGHLRSEHDTVGWVRLPAVRRWLDARASKIGVRLS